MDFEPTFFDHILLAIALFWVAAFVLLILICGIFSKFKQNKNELVKSLLILASFSFFGFVLGLMTGNSREPVMHAVLPAILAFFGGFVAFILNKDGGANRILAVVILLVVSITVLYGAVVGSQNRHLAELELRNYNEKIVLYESEVEPNTYLEKKRIDSSFLSVYPK